MRPCLGYDFGHGGRGRWARAAEVWVEDWVGRGAGRLVSVGTAATAATAPGFGVGRGPEESESHDERPIVHARHVGLVAIDAVTALLSRLLRPWSTAIVTSTSPSDPVESGAHASRRTHGHGYGGAARVQQASAGLCWAVGSEAQTRGMGWIGGGAGLMRSRWALSGVQARYSPLGERPARVRGAPRLAVGTSSPPSMLRQPSFFGFFSNVAGNALQSAVTPEVRQV